MQIWKEMLMVIKIFFFQFNQKTILDEKYSLFQVEYDQQKIKQTQNDCQFTALNGYNKQCVCDSNIPANDKCKEACEF